MNKRTIAILTTTSCHQEFLIEPALLPRARLTVMASLSPQMMKLATIVSTSPTLHRREKRQTNRCASFTLMNACAHVITILLMLTASSAFAATPKTSACLLAADTKDCLASSAVSMLASDKSSKSKIEGYASLISSMAKAGFRRDNILLAATDDEAAPASSNWELSVARRTYALHFGVATASIDSPQHIEEQAALLRGGGDVMDRIFVAIAACEAREGEPLDAVAKWNGVLDRLCKIDVSDAEVLDNEYLGFPLLVYPLINACNRDEVALRKSINLSIDVLSENEKALERKMPATKRKAIYTMVIIGHISNATALMISGHVENSVQAVEVTLGHLAKFPEIRKTIVLPLVLSQASLIYAKAGMQDKAMVALRKSLAQVDAGKGLSGGDKATVIGISIETLSILEALKLSKHN